MELPLIGELGLNTGIVLMTALVALMLHLSMNTGKPSGPQLDERALESLLLGEDDDDADDEDGGWDDDGEAQPERPTAASANAAAARIAAEQKKMRFGSASEENATRPKKQRVPPPLPQKINEGPFSIGDRVVLRNLQSAKELNGRHGIIADLWDKSTERYPVDLDLYDPRRGGAISVKATNMVKEPPVSAENEESRAPVDKGVLSEQHGRAVSFVCSSMRQSVANTVKSTDPKKIANFCWMFWRTPNNKGVYPSLSKYLLDDITKDNTVDEIEKQLNPTQPKGSYDLIRNAMTSTRAVRGWNVRVTGEFWIIGGNSDGTLVIPTCNTRTVYCVAGLRLPLAVQIMQQTKCPRPPKFNLTLLPWFGRLVHDPFISTTSGTDRVEVASPLLTSQLMQSSRLAEAEGRIIKSLAQLEVPGGSTDGVPFVPFGTAASSATSAASEQVPPAEKQEPATEAERALIDNVPDFEPFELTPPGPDGRPPPMAAWNFIRKSESEEDNPNHDIFIINAAGQQIDRMKSKDMDPTAGEILRKMLVISIKVGRRPSILGVDCPGTVARLQFLLQETKDISVVGISVKRTRNPNAAAGAGGDGDGDGGGGADAPAPALAE